MRLQYICRLTFDLSTYAPTEFLPSSQVVHMFEAVFVISSIILLAGILCIWLPSLREDNALVVGVALVSVGLILHILNFALLWLSPPTLLIIAIATCFLLAAWFAGEFFLVSLVLVFFLSLLWHQNVPLSELEAQSSLHSTSF